MSRSNSSLAQSSRAPATETVSTDASTVVDTPKLTTDLSQVDAMPSPALDLQENLRNAWTAADTSSRPAGERKIPVGWALTAVLVGCGAVWACVALVIF